MQPENFIYCDISEKNIYESKKRIDKLLKDHQNPDNLPKNIFPVLINQEKWPFKDNSINCIINNLYLHNVENLEEHLRKLNNSLVPDGCLISNFYTDNTLNELKFIMSLAESEREGGLSPNVLPFPHISDFGNLVQKLGYTLPSFSLFKYRYKFNDLGHLFEFLEIIGESNFLSNRRNYKKKDTYIAAMALYHSIYGQSKNKNIDNDEFRDIRTINIDFRMEKNTDDDFFILATFEVGSFISWKFHPSQPKPKQRGSAEVNLKDIASEVLEAEKDDIRYGSIRPKEGENNEDFEIIEMTEMIKEKIRNKLGDEALKEKLNNIDTNKDNPDNKDK